MFESHHQLQAPQKWGFSFSHLPCGMIRKLPLKGQYPIRPRIRVTSPAPKKNFCFQKFFFCIQAAGLAYHPVPQEGYIISPFGAVSHHAPACMIACGLMIYDALHRWYTMLRIDDIPQQVADDIQWFCFAIIF